MKIEYPIPMTYKDETLTEKDVLVYDFIHDITDTFMSLALCWVPSNQSWLTVSVGLLTPKVSKQLLTETTINKI